METRSTLSESRLPASAGEREIPRFARRYAAVLAAIGCLVLLDQALLQPLLFRLNGFAPVINLAGRQRMLSQKVTKSALAVRWSADAADARQHRDDLTRDLAEWGRVHVGLQEGDELLELPAARSAEIRAAFASLDADVATMRAAAQRVATSTATDAEAATAVRTLLETEARYLPQMDRIVGLFERDARQQVTQLRWIGFSLAGVILLLLVSLGRFVVRPATALIRAQLDELVQHEAELCAARDDLEVRVAERTRQLSEANAALRLEMTERERAEQHARRVLAQLAHVSRVRVAGQLATGLAHELNQPLGAVANSAETAEVLLERETPDLSGIRGSLRRIRDAALRAGAIIRRMRNFLRPAARERVISDLDMLIAEAAELCATECVQAGISMERQLDADDATVQVDPIQIQQVFVNLVQNAIQAMHAIPQPERRLSVRTHLDHGAAVVEVADHGPGFADPEAALGAFYSSKPDGLGLGLAISRSIVEDHGGRLWIDAAPGRGARVLFSLPIVAGSATPLKESRTELVPSSL